MKKLALAAVALAGLSQATGCIISDAEGGQMHLSWTVTLDGAAVNSCADVGGANPPAKVETLSTLEGTAAAVADRWPCDEFEGTTGELDEGTYTVVVSILEADNTAIVSFDPETGVPVTSGDVTELGTFNFAFETANPPVTMSLYVDYGAAGGMNCTETAVGGSGVIQQNVFLFDVGGTQCLNFAITGTDQEGLPIDGDTCGSTELCMENTVAQLVDLPAGTYEIDVEGWKGATGGNPVLCYRLDAPIQFTISVNSDVDVVVPFNPDPADDVECNATKPSR
jgi:hypothetical protein